VIPVAPIYTIPTVGYIDTRIHQQIIVPPVILAPRPRAEEYDLSGVDLDVSPSPLLADRFKPAKRPPEKAPEPVPPIVKKKEPPKGKEKEPPKVVVPPKVEPKIEKPVEPPSLLDEGVSAFRTAEYGLAAFRFRQVTLGEPTNARAFFLLAQAYIAQGKFSDAVDAIQGGLKQDPDFPLKKFHPRTELYKDMEDEYLLQRKLLDELVAKGPANGKFLFVQGYLHWFDERRAEARKSFAAARPLLADPWHVDRFLKVAEK
jgi:hypothetical protein